MMQNATVRHGTIARTKLATGDAAARKPQHARRSDHDLDFAAFMPIPA